MYGISILAICVHTYFIVILQAALQLIGDDSFQIMGQSQINGGQVTSVFLTLQITKLQECNFMIY